MGEFFLQNPYRLYYLFDPLMGQEKAVAADYGTIGYSLLFLCKFGAYPRIDDLSVIDDMDLFLLHAIAAQQFFIRFLMNDQCRAQVKLICHGL